MHPSAAPSAQPTQQRREMSLHRREALDRLTLRDMTRDLLRRDMRRTRSDIAHAIPEVMDRSFENISAKVPLAGLLHEFGIGENQVEFLPPESFGVNFYFDGTQDARMNYQRLNEMIRPFNGCVVAIPPGEKFFQVTVVFPHVNNATALFERLAASDLPCRFSLHPDSIQIGSHHDFPVFLQGTFRRSPLDTDTLPAGNTASLKSFPKKGHLHDPAYYSFLRTSEDLASASGMVIEISMTSPLGRHNRRFWPFIDQLRSIATDIQLNGMTITAVVQMEGAEASVISRLEKQLKEVIPAFEKDAGIPWQILMASGEIRQQYLGGEKNSPRRFCGPALEKLEYLRDVCGKRPGVYCTSETKEMTQTSRQRTKVRFHAEPFTDDPKVLVVKTAREIFDRLETGGPLEMVGREEQFGEVMRLVESFFLGKNDFQHQRVWLDGEPGIGKSRFMEEIQKEIQKRFKRRGSALYYSSREHHKNDNGFGIYTILHDKLRPHFSPEVWEKYSFFQQEKSFSQFDNPVELANRIYELMGECQKPLALFLDDCQWLDQFSVRVFQNLCRMRPPKLLLVGADRGVRGAEEASQDRAPRDFRETFMGPSSGTLATTLERLNFADNTILHRFIQSFFAARFGGRRFTGSLPDTTARRLADASEGNPLSLKERLEALADHGVVIIESGVLQLTGRFEDVVSETVSKTHEELYKGRLLRLVSTGKKHLFDLLAWVHAYEDLPERVLLEILGSIQISGLFELRAQGLIQTDPLKFSHGELHKAYLGLASAADVQAIVGNAAELLHHEFTRRKGAAEIPTTLLYRLAQEGGRGDIADEYGILAGLEAVNRLDYDSAYRILQDVFGPFDHSRLKSASELDPYQSQLAASMILRLGNSAIRLSRFSDASQYLDSCQPYIGNIQDECSKLPFSLQHLQSQLDLHYFTGDTINQMQGLIDQYKNQSESKSALGRSLLEQIRSVFLIYLYKLRAFYRHRDYLRFQEEYRRGQEFINTCRDAERDQPKESKLLEHRSIQPILAEIQRIAGNVLYGLCKHDHQGGEFDHEQMLFGGHFDDDRRQYAESALISFAPVLRDAQEGRPLMEVAGAISAFESAASLQFYLGNYVSMQDLHERGLSMAYRYGIPEQTIRAKLEHGERLHLLSRKFAQSPSPRLQAQSRPNLEAAIESFQSGLDLSTDLNNQNYTLSLHIDMVHALADYCQNAGAADPEPFERFFRHLAACLNCSVLHEEPAYQLYISQVFSDMISVCRRAPEPFCRVSSQFLRILDLSPEIFSHLQSWYSAMNTKDPLKELLRPLFSSGLRNL